MYKKLSILAKNWCNFNHITTDKDLKEILKELRITLRLDYDIPATSYGSWSPSQIIEEIIKHSKLEKITGS